MPQGKKTDSKIRVAIEEIMRRYKLTSSIQIASKMKEEFGIKITRQTVSNIMKEVTVAVEDEFTKSQQDSMEIYQRVIKNMKKLSRDAKNKADVVKAHNTILKAQRQLDELRSQYRAESLIKTESTRPNHLICICTSSAVVKCPNCKKKFVMDTTENNQKQLDRYLKEHKHELTESAKKDWETINVKPKISKKDSNVFGSAK